MVGGTRRTVDSGSLNGGNDELNNAEDENQELHAVKIAKQSSKSVTT